MSPRVRLLLAVTIGVAATAGVAAANGKGKQVRYVGIHPILKAHGGGLCHIEAPHVHVYAPGEPVQYRDHDGRHFFVGDPAAYGWDGVKTTYFGHHPIYVDAVVELAADPGEPEYCYLDGPHYHVFAPPTTLSSDWKLAGNAYFYVGAPPPAYVEARPALVKVNAIYKPIEYERPVVEVEPPAAWIGVQFAPVPVVIEDRRGRPGAVVVDGVVAPGAVQIDVRPPSLSVGLDVGIGGGVVIGGRGKHKPQKYKPMKFKAGKPKGKAGPKVRDHR